MHAIPLMMSVLTLRGRTRLSLYACVALVGVLSACASVPYQQMSDARQAIDSAVPVAQDTPGADELLQDALEMLEQAERHLHAGEYGPAREYADEARRLAIESREAAELQNAND